MNKIIKQKLTNLLVDELAEWWTIKELEESCMGHQEFIDKLRAVVEDILDKEEFEKIWELR